MSTNGDSIAVDEDLVKRVNCYSCPVHGNLCKDTTVHDLLTVYLGAIHILNGDYKLTPEKRQEWLQQKLLVENALRGIIKKA